MKYAHGTHASAICDICGLTVPYNSLKPIVEFRKPTGMLACDDCWVEDHPQNALKDLRNVQDAEALRNPRPEDNNPGLTNIWWGWNPVYSLVAKGEVGQVQVTTP